MAEPEARDLESRALRTIKFQNNVQSRTRKLRRDTIKHGWLIGQINSKRRRSHWKARERHNIVVYIGRYPHLGQSGTRTYKGICNVPCSPYMIEREKTNPIWNCCFQSAYRMNQHLQGPVDIYVRTNWPVLVLYLGHRHAEVDWCYLKRRWNHSLPEAELSKLIVLLKGNGARRLARQRIRFPCTIKEYHPAK